jgi:GAF domain-containing protein
MAGWSASSRCSRGAPQAYSDDDLTNAKPLAGHLAVALARQRFEEQARNAALERERAASIETSIELLRAIADVLDIRTVFPCLSEIANKMLIMSFVDQDGTLVREATSRDDLPKPPTW